MKSSIGVSTKVICTLIIVLVIIPVSFFGFTLKFVYTREQYRKLYFIPIERKIEDIENQTQDNFKVNYANFEIKLPGKKIDQRYDSASEFKPIFVRIYKGKLIVIQIPVRIPPKDKNRKETSFDTYCKMFYMTPYQLNLFNPDDFERKYTLLMLKGTSFLRGKIYKFETPNIKDFQFGDPNNTRKYAEVKIFDKNDNQY